MNHLLERLEFLFMSNKNNKTVSEFFNDDSEFLFTERKMLSIMSHTSCLNMSRIVCLECKINWSISLTFKICLFFVISEIFNCVSTCLNLENSIFSKIAFDVLLCSRFISMKDLNYDNEDLVDHVHFWEGLTSNEFSKNEVANIKKFIFIQLRFAINNY